MRKTTQVFVLLLLIFAGCNRQANLPAPQLAKPVLPDDDRKLSSAVIENAIKLVEGQVTRSVCEPTIIDTRKFKTQINRIAPFGGPVKDVGEIRQGEASVPALPQLAASGLDVDGNITTEPRIETLSRFPGISQSIFTPPDPTLAVGPNHIVEMVNSEMAFLSKTDGTVQFQAFLGNQGTPGFFEDLGADDFVFDPRCVYDHYVDRFVILAVETITETNEAFLNLAVSDDDDPNGVWFRYRTRAQFEMSGDITFADYPSLGFDENGYYVSGNLFGVIDRQFRGLGVRTMDKTPLLNGDPMEFNDLFSTIGFSVQMAQGFDSPDVPLGAFAATTTEIAIVAINNPFVGPSIQTVNVAVPSFNFNSSVANNAGEFVSIVDARIMNTHVRNGRLYTCHTITLDNSIRNVVRWYEFDLNGWPNGSQPVLLQSGNIDPGGNVETFFPSIYANQNGSIAVVYGSSSPSDLISVNIAGRIESDPPGTMSEFEQVDISGSTVDGRFGDYFDSAIDPDDDTTFWVVGETGESFGWDTIIQSFAVPVPGDVNCDGVVDLLDVQPFIEILGSGEFSAKADINGDGVVNLLDVQPFVDLLSGA